MFRKLGSVLVFIGAAVSFVANATGAGPATPSPSATPATAATSGPTADLPQMYAQAMATFQAGNFAQAASMLEAILAKAEFTPQLEPLYFTLGSAYFNAGDAGKAITAFKNYQGKFPQGPHLNEALFALAQSSLTDKNYAEAAAQFNALEKDPKLREQALLFEAIADKESAKLDQAVAALEKLTAGEIKTPSGARGLMLLAQIYAQKGAAEKAVQTLTRLRQQVDLIDNVVELNALAVDLGDQLYAKKQQAEALECYRAAFPRDQVARMQSDRIARMQKAIEANTTAVKTDPTLLGQLNATNSQLRTDIAKAQQLLVDFQKLPDFTPAIYLRMARSFYDSDRKWEAAVVYQDLLDRSAPDAKEREPALFGMILALADVNQGEKAMALCQQYLRDFKNGPNAETVGYLLGVTALQANDPRAAQTYFGSLLESQPKGKFREQIRYLLGNAKFSAGQYDEATAEYKKYLTDFPNGASVEEVNYRIALTALFAGQYEAAMNSLNDYLKKYPRGSFVSDARYRLAVCKYAASLYADVIADCEKWEHDFAGNAQLGEVLSLSADAYAATEREDQAIPIYIRAYKAANRDEVMNYALFAASKLLQKKSQWNKVADLFQEFIKDKPDNPSVITALYWIGKAKAHEGNVDEAKKITADTIKKYIADPQREAVELLLTQLAQLCVKKKHVDESTAGNPATDPGAELDTLLGQSEAEQAPTARARVLFAKAELARLRRQAPEEEKNVAQIADGFKPEDLSAALLGRAGDSLLARHKLDAALPFYQRLMDEFPKSDSLDFAYNGMGEIAFEKMDYAKALRYFSDGTDRIAASQKLKDVTVGKAKTLLALGKLDEAKKGFEQVAQVREWRGETTAFSVYSLGEIEAKQNHWAEANAYFQRVYVGYQKFLPWVAKAYLRSGESFEKMGKTQEAANTYRELLRNEKLTTFGEAEEARKKLASMGQPQAG